MSLIQANGGNSHIAHSVNHADQSTLQNEHGAQPTQSGHHALNIGNLSNGNMLGSDYQYWNLSNFVEGLKINTGMRFAVLFIAFAGWLYIIYWIRHHEPFANQAIGVQTAIAPTASQDKHLVDAMRSALPVRTSSNMGELYIPSPATVQQSPEFSLLNTSQVSHKMLPNTHLIENRPLYGPGQAISAPVEYPRLTIDERFGSPTNSSFPSELPAFTPTLPMERNGVFQSNTELVNINQAPSIYQIRVTNGQNNLLRTIVSR